MGFDYVFGDSEWFCMGFEGGGEGIRYYEV